MQLAEVLKPNVMVPGNLIWGAWSPTSDALPEIQGKKYALLSHKHGRPSPCRGGGPDQAEAPDVELRHGHVSDHDNRGRDRPPADVTDRSSRPLMARNDVGSVDPTTPFDMGAGAVNAARALDPGLVFDAEYSDYLWFLCAVPGVDDAAVLRAMGAPCPPPPRAGAPQWCSDQNSTSVTVASLLGSRHVDQPVTSVGAQNETYTAYVRAPGGVAVRVSPSHFAIAPGASRTLRIVLDTTAARNAFSFGEVVLRSDKKHRVQIPLAVYPAAALSP